VTSGLSQVWVKIRRSTLMNRRAGQRSFRTFFRLVELVFRNEAVKAAAVLDRKNLEFSKSETQQAVNHRGLTARRLTWRKREDPRVT
jgi:hypothetical protein